ncbi:hypothetical protein GGS20DRAFT_523379 [Poronia punctata]|nr:hypothetical protein GGS20DRAFT_523379 [Poronia punctata]
MLATMPAHTFSFEFSSPHRPAVPSPLSSSPLRPSQSSPPLSPRDTNALPRRGIQSSPIRGPPSKFKYASRNIKPNPLRLSREKTQEGRRNLFMKNVRQRADDRKWEQRGGDQETLKLEWQVLNRKWREQKAADLDGFVFEEDIEDIPEEPETVPFETDDMMVDVVAQEEEAEMNAMLSLLDTTLSSRTAAPPDTSTLADDDDYDALFMDILTQEDGGGTGFAAPSSQMDLS